MSADFSRPRFISNSFSVIFPPRAQIRRLANAIEDIVTKAGYFQPHIIPVPDEFDNEVPRILFGSEHGFSQIVISNTNISLNINYSPDWQLNIELGQKYLSDRIEILFRILSEAINASPIYCGLITKVRLASKADIDTCINILSEKHLTDQVKTSLREIKIKRTIIEDEKYYYNVTINNYRTWKDEIGKTGIRHLHDNKIIEHGLEITTDFNDRHSFNKDIAEEYQTNIDAALVVLERGIKSAVEVIDNLLS